MKSSSSILSILQTASQFIDSSDHEELLRDLDLIVKSFVDPVYRIAVLGQFNIGKSTFINAVLGNDILPVKMVRSTGTVINIRYGKKLAITVYLDTGEFITSSHPEILKEFAVLSPKGYRREDVLRIEVFYPHPILMNGVELMDLPGTNDQNELDNLVKNQLLQADLVIQVLNARQPFSKCERDTLNQWLSARGIQTFIFVLNRMNEISSPKDKAEIYNHLSSSLRAFKPQLLNGLKNLFRVDALPALEAKQKKNKNHILKSGIYTFEINLHTIILLQKKKIRETRITRVIIIARRVQVLLQSQAQILSGQILQADNLRNIAIEKGKKEEEFLQKEFRQRVESYKDWLALDNLVASFQVEAAHALEKGEFDEWQRNKLQSNNIDKMQSIERFIRKACVRLDLTNPFELLISLPPLPNPIFPDRQSRNAGQWINDIFNGGENRRRLDQEYERVKWKKYNDAIHSCFTIFSKTSLASLEKYEKNVSTLLIFVIPLESQETVSMRSQLYRLNTSIDDIKGIDSFTLRNKSLFLEIVEFCKARIYFLMSWIKLRSHI